ncbi:hypothetical protein DLAC_07772 [Tieghemostelium lacteum]|uniref:Carbohydrate binding domain-containing protein n=1 Tax=Tieghemostelium lacteum TaxID=361077 RepID=A0A151ZAC9_TIELA|nr:hypothetical protein DLAC_07772 [Tieghemostelium lacteum]|eukprot:KYQ90899.1 hypothetical protein DLAC_07772 [Tieghemostelium lacteum]
MKYLIILSLCLIASIVGASNCPTPTGFSGYIGTVSYGPGNDGFVESTYLSIDYEGGRLYTSFEVSTNGQNYTGTTIEFSGNNTQYVIATDGNGVDTCFEYSGTNIPTGLPTGFVNIGEVTLGVIEVQELLSNDTIVLWDAVNCAPMSVTQSGNEQVTLSNIYMYENGFRDYLFQLPESCYNPSNLMKLHFNHRKPSNIRLPHRVKFIMA